MTYLLDTMVVSYFQKAGRETELVTAAKCCPMALVDEVCRELQAAPKGGGKHFTAWLATSHIAVRTIPVGSPASASLAQLLNPVTPDKGRGEHASIALAAHDASLTFVTHDTNGMRMALRELWMPGERILGLAVFLRRLFDRGGLSDPAVLDDVLSLASDAAQRPTWWPAWRTGLSTPPTAAAAQGANGASGGKPLT